VPRSGFLHTGLLLGADPSAYGFVRCTCTVCLPPMLDTIIGVHWGKENLYVSFGLRVDICYSILAGSQFESQRETPL
jgi:hypothetical protein